MVSITRIVVAALVALSCAAGAQPMIDEIAKAHREAKEAIDPTLPKRIDGVTVLTAVRDDGITFTYEYKIERDRAELPPEFKDALGKKALAIACGNDRSRKILQAGGRYGFEYSDKFDQMLLSVTVSKHDCI
jgi:hypothetical protein